MRVPAMVDMRRTPAEKEEQVEKMSAEPSTIDIPDYPYGLRICLCEEELEKLGLEHDDVEVGDFLHIHAFAKVCSVSTNEDETGDRCRIELVLCYISAEDEDEEDEESEREERRPY